MRGEWLSNKEAVVIMTNLTAFIEVVENKIEFEQILKKQLSNFRA